MQTAKRSPPQSASSMLASGLLAENNIVGKDGFGCFMRSYTNAEKEEKLAAQRAEQSTRDASMAELLLEAMALDVPRAELASSARKAFEANTTVAQFQIDAVAAEIVDLQDITFPAAETDDERENVKSLIAKLENLRNGIREKADAYEAEKQARADAIAAEKAEAERLAAEEDEAETDPDDEPYEDTYDS